MTRPGVFLRSATRVFISAILATLIGCAGSESHGGDAPPPAPGEPAVAVSTPMSRDPMALGSDSAALTVIEFSDYQCPYCRRFHADVLPALRRDYIDTGKVQLIFKDFPLAMHREALPAAIAGRCAAAQGKFWPMNELLFANQEKLNATLYPKLAAALSLDAGQFKKCLRDPALRQAIRRDQNQARDLGITSTPSFLIGRMQGERMLIERVGRGSADFEALSAELDKLLAADAPDAETEQGGAR